MDIKQLRYFVEIVNCKCNLSMASKILNVSQPALSLAIRNFEEYENVQLFKRYNGRLQQLTPIGTVFYENAVQLIEMHQDMISRLRESSGVHRGKVSLGIPPFILGTLFSELLPALIAENPHIEFDIWEIGAFGLKNSLLAKALDMAVLLMPTGIDKEQVDEYMLVEGELVAFLSTDNPIATKEVLEWQDLDGKNLSIFNNSFMINHLLLEKFSQNNISTRIKILSAHWDYLLMSVRSSNFITILPPTVKNLPISEDITERRFDKPILWKVVLCVTKKPHYSQLEQFVVDSIVEYFTGACRHTS